MTEELFSTGDVVSFERDGKTYTGKVVTYDPWGRNGPTYVVECGPTLDLHFHVPGSFLRLTAGNDAR